MPNYRWDFNQTLQACSVPYIVVPISGIFCFPAYMASRARNRKILTRLHQSIYWWGFNQTLLEWSVPSPVLGTFSTRSASLHKMAPELKIETSCPAFPGQSTDGISTKLYRSNQYHPWLCIIPAWCTLLHKMTARSNLFVSGLNRSNYWWDFNKW
jgi:hypothetical protein